ncbi:MAG: hypothetical protein HZC11_01185 [Nitrospirae bacterium]|nr:hypothetical protein [Nitrospirota bacterium]
MKSGRTLTTRFTIALLIILIVCQSVSFIFFIAVTRKSLGTEIFNKIMVSALAGQAISLITSVAAVSILFARNVSKTISNLNTDVRRIVTGDLTVSIQPVTVPVIADLTKNLNSLIIQFRDNIRKSRLAAGDTIVNVEKIKSFLDKVADDTNNQFVFTEKVILALKGAETAQKNILDSTYKFSKSMEEDVSSLTQINSIIEEISENTEQFSRLLNEVYSAIAKMVASAKEISKNTGDFSVSTSQTIASVTEIAQNLNDIEKGAKESSTLTSQVRQIASDTGMLTVANAMEGMEKIAESVNRSFTLVSHLSAMFKDIEKILSVITNVTKQTNLLSLNAAILAEQAGEYGKGFAVIAEEIKTLSDRTAFSTKEITEIINNLREEISSTITVTGDSAQIVENGTALIVRTGEAFREVIDTARKSDEMAKIIQKATEEQVRGIAEINTAIENLQKIVEQILTAAEEEMQGSEHIWSAREKLKDISELIKRNMQEQSAVTKELSKSFDTAHESVKQITGTSSGQEKVYEELILVTDKVKTACYNTTTIIQELTGSFNKLNEEMAALKKNTEGFKFE